jgi:hypothetical protein
MYEYEDGQPCYFGVGKSSRMHDHLREARRGHIGSNPAKCQYFIDCFARGFEPPVRKVADKLTPEEALAHERLLVKLFGRRDLGTGCLLNASDGGFGTRHLASSTRARLSEAARKQIASPETRARIAEAARKRWALPEARAGQAEATRKRMAASTAEAPIAPSLTVTPMEKTNQEISIWVVLAPRSRCFRRRSGHWNRARSSSPRCRHRSRL